MRDSSPSDWFIAGMFFTLGAMSAIALVGIVIVVVGVYIFGVAIHR